jgi:hypothetical protein
VSGRAVLCDRGVDESIDALVLVVAEEATKNKATTTVFVFVLVVLRLPDRLILSFFPSFFLVQVGEKTSAQFSGIVLHTQLDRPSHHQLVSFLFFFFFGL